MSNLSDNDIRKVWATLSLTCRQSKDWMDPEYRKRQMTLWHIGLGDLNAAQAEAAAASYAADPDRASGYTGPAMWPDPGQVRRRAERLTAEVTGARALEAQDAWGYLLRHIGGLCGVPPGFGDFDGKGEMYADSRVVFVRNGGRTEWVNHNEKTLRSREDARWTMHREHATCAAMEAATLAVGGWKAVQAWNPEDASTRMRWQAAYNAAINREAASTSDRAVLGALGLRDFGRLEVHDGGKKRLGDGG